jgi:quercetin dioxygenase-like cupin family protein
MVRRMVLVLSVALVALLGTAAVRSQPGAFAQQASPTAAEGMPQGVAFQTVSFAPAIALPGHGDLIVIRATLDPNGVIPIEATDPTLGILLVESGTLTVQVQGPVMVTRGQGLDVALATAEATGNVNAAVQTMAGGQSVTLQTGDAAYVPANTAGEIRNASQGQAVGLIFLVSPTDNMAGEATPTP